MSYTKTQWVNNTTPINDTNLNKIEQGIYDNSLVVDAVTNTLNPTDTETYKTAELTEGQITDVIGVNDIVIKGQTEQDGTPTPSAPVDVNVVSGSNVINTSNKNLLSFPNIETTNNGITYKISNGILKLSGTATAAIAINSPIFNLAAGTYMFTRNIRGSLNGSWQTYIRDVTTGDSSLVAGSGNFTITETKQVQFRLFMNSGVNGTDITFYPMLEVGSTATTYEPHQGKELPLDLPVENLFDKNNITDSQFINADGTLSSSINYVTTDFIPITPNTKYYLPKTSTRRLKYFNSNKQVLSSSDWDIASSTIGQVLTTPANAYYVRFSIDKAQNDINTFQFEQGSKANAYTPYGTTPIELCKIGNYQDYFYKSGSKWYLHKEVEKVILDGSESWNRSSNGAFYPATNLLLNIILPSNSSSLPLLLSNKFIASIYTDVWDNNKDFGIALASNGSNNPRIRNNSIDNVNDFKSWLADNLPSIYCAKSTPTDTEITDTTLISQLEAIYNAPLYEQTNITQTNNDLPMVLDITACKDNINGIKAFIRK